MDTVRDNGSWDDDASSALLFPDSSHLYHSRVTMDVVSGENDWHVGE